MLKRFMVRVTHTALVTAANEDEAREIALAKAKKAFDNDYETKARIEPSAENALVLPELKRPEGNEKPWFGD